MAKAKRIVDDNGMPKFEECSYIKIPTDKLKKVEKYLKEEDISFNTFENAGHAYCESEAERRLRDYYMKKEDIEDENTLEQKAIDNKGCLGQYLYSYLCEEGYLDDDHIDEIIEEYFEDDAIELEEEDDE